jgi:hypothetical protein
MALQGEQQRAVTVAFLRAQGKSDKEQKKCGVGICWEITLTDV